MSQNIKVSFIHYPDMNNILLRSMHCKPTGMNAKQPVTPHWPLPHAVMHCHLPDACNNALILSPPCVYSLHMTKAQVTHQGDILYFPYIIDHNEIVHVTPNGQYLEIYVHTI